MSKSQKSSRKKKCLHLSNYAQKSNFTKDEFKKAVQKAKSYIKSGDIFQVVLSQKFERKTLASSTNIYRALRRINPSPYLFHLKFQEFDIIGSSPEMMVNVNQKIVNIRPIAGTRKRGKDETEGIRNGSNGRARGRKGLAGP